jgi:hypothetical protein
MSFSRASRPYGEDAMRREVPMAVDSKGPLPQGDLRLLDTDVAQQLLGSSVPARLGYTARDGTPRVVPTWFHWTGDELVMPTFLRAPHVSRPAARLGDLRANPDVAVCVDTERFPPHVLLVAGLSSPRRTASRRSAPWRRAATWETTRPRRTWPRSTSRARGWRASRCDRPGWASSTSRPDDRGSWPHDFGQPSAATPTDTSKALSGEARPVGSRWVSTAGKPNC